MSGSRLRHITGVRTSALGLVAFVLRPDQVLACAACYGQSDSPMAAGMNWGIFSLLGVVVFVLGSVAGFFVFLAKRAASGAVHPPIETGLESSGAAWPQRWGGRVRGHSEVGKRWVVGVFQRVGRVRHCCSRGGAHSGTRNLWPGPIDPSL
jgi:hypothetical protein